MTEQEWELVDLIGSHVAGPRHTTTIVAGPENMDLIKSLVEQGLVESTGPVQGMSEPMLRVCLSAKGWVRYKDGKPPGP